MKHWPLTIIGNPENRRVTFFQDALRRQGLAQALVVPYRRLLRERRAQLEALGQRGGVVRLESPGEDAEVERRLIALGADEEPDQSHPRIGAQQALALPDDRGRVWYTRQWYLGWRRLMGELGDLKGAVSYWNDPAQIATMFDKRACHRLFEAHGVPTTRSLGVVEDYGALVAAMEALGHQRVFVKLAHGSSASGVVAYSRRDGQEMALTSMERVVAEGQVRFYNSLRLRRYGPGRALEEVIDAVCAQGAQVEAWIPKLRQKGRPVDLRVVVIDGRATHVVARQGRSPMTNLHLGGGRADVEALEAYVGEDRWRSALEASQAAAAVFPDCLCAGVDVVFDTHGGPAAVIEINAFGDLLPRITHGGLDTYEAQVVAWKERAC